MDQLSGFTSEQREMLQYKIYAVCYNFLDIQSKSECLPDILLNEGKYGVDDLLFPALVYDACEAIALPKEIIYSRFEYLDYFETDEPEPLSIKKFADILINILEIYQTQWKRFRALSEQDQEQYYTKIYDVLKKYLPLHHTVFSPKKFVNKGDYAVRGYKAKRMVKKVAFIMGLSKSETYDIFDAHDYFSFPIAWSLIFFYILFSSIGIVYFLVGTIFSIIFGVAFLLWALVYLYRPENTSAPMTAKEFADKIIGMRLVENFYNNQKNKEE